MKIVSSYSVMFCFMFMIAAFFTTTWGSCDLDYKLGISGCPAYKRMYSIYKKLESILTNDAESLHLMRQGFFPASVTHFFETERVNVVRIRVCWIPNETRPPPACNSLDLPHKPGSFEQMLLQLLESFPLCAEIGNEPDFSILPRTIAGTHIQWP